MKQTREQQLNNVEQQIADTLISFSAVHGPEVTTTVSGLFRLSLVLSHYSVLLFRLGAGKIEHSELMKLATSLDSEATKAIMQATDKELKTWTPEFRQEVSRFLRNGKAIMDSLHKQE